IAFADAQLAGRRDTVIAGIIRNTLATATYAQQDYATSLSRSGQAAQIFEDVLAHPPPRTSETRKDQLRRLAALALAASAGAELAMRDRDAADASYERALPYARQIPNRDLEVEILRGQGNIAFARKDWTKALGLFQQALPLAGQLKRPTAVMWLNNDLARALGALGRTDEALAASREAGRRAEELRGELSDADQRGAFLDDKQGIYRQAVRLALQAQRPDEAFALAERGRSRAFLDMLGSQTTLSKGRTRGLVDEEVRLRARRRAGARPRVSGPRRVRAHRRAGRRGGPRLARLSRARSQPEPRASLADDGRAGRDVGDPEPAPDGHDPAGISRRRRRRDGLGDRSSPRDRRADSRRPSVARDPGARISQCDLQAVAARSGPRAGRDALRSTAGSGAGPDRGRSAVDRAARRASLRSVRRPPVAGSPLARRGIRARDVTERERAPL